jgi:predicted membrane-bound spermidine synthase
MFFCSGASALVYEVVWSKYLSQMLGSTVHAQTVVLAVFMGGLALGNYLFGRKAASFRMPVRVYGILEALIGLYAFFFSSIYSSADSLFVSLGSNLLEKPLWLFSLKAALSVILLAGPTILMGGTLPLMAAWLERNNSEAGRASALFYGINSLGAVAGAFLAGFYLVQSWGMVASLQLTALLNILVGAVAFMIGKHNQIPDVPDTPSTQEPLPARAPTDAQGPLTWAIVIVAVTGGVSMGLEILSARSLALIFGSSLQSFAVVLMAFILGIGLGSAMIAKLKLVRISAQALLTFLLLTAAIWIAVLVWRIENWVDIYRIVRSGIARTSTGYVFNQLFSAAMAMMILGFPAALIGSVLPLLIRVVSDGRADLARSVGRLLTWNTLGAVFGVLITGFVIMPWAGLRNAFVVLALALCTVAGLMAARNALHKGAVCSGVAAVAMIGLLAFAGDGWRHVLSSGVFRAAETEFDKTAMADRKKEIQFVYYKDAADATVTVERRSINGVTNVGLRINGKPEASSHGDKFTQLLVAHLPIFARPESQDVFLFGMGSGITASAALAHPIRRLYVAENCRPVLEAAAWFNPYSDNVLTNSHLKVFSEDARTILKLSPQTYDVIISQPSNPWTAGIGSVFSLEFYELAASRLKKGGIMAQWFHVYEMHDSIVGVVLRTFSRVFPHMEIWDCNSGDIVILGSQQPWTSSPATYSTGMLRPLPVKHMADIGISSPIELFARQLASQKTAFAIAGDGPIQQDWMPLLEYHAPRAFFMGGRSQLLTQFDERTWQVEVAPLEKRRWLESLSETQLRTIFNGGSSMNDELIAFVRDSLGPDSISPTIQRLIQYRTASSIFGHTNGVSRGLVQAASNQRLSERERQLLRARWLIESSDGARNEAIRTLENLLSTRSVDDHLPISRYVALAIRASLTDGDESRARALLARSLAIAPDDQELHYLSRLITHDRSPQIATRYR